MEKDKEKQKQQEEKEEKFESQLLHLTRVERMKAGGRRLRFRAVVIVGNRKGKVGLGIGKALDVAESIEKAKKKAMKNIIEVPITEKGTIPHEVEAKFGAARVFLRPQKEGKGLIAGGVVRIICSLAGIENISSKLLSKSRNKINNARATIKALSKLKVFK